MSQAQSESRNIVVRFERIRRVTGYLVGDVRRRFNNAKQAEEHDRVKHGGQHVQSL